MESGMRDVRLASRLARGRRWSAPFAALSLAWVGGCCTTPPEEVESNIAAEREPRNRRVTGIGGVFFETADPGQTLEWYRSHLGIDSADWGGYSFEWLEKDQANETGYTVWAAFPESIDHFSPGDQTFMVNFRVADLTGLVAQLKEEGIEVVGEVEEHPNGKFAWILDPDGRKVELWEPVPSADDPYLQ